MIKRRQSWHDYFLGQATLVATRATCDRLNVGCIIVRDNRQMVSGYNGSPEGEDHCDEVGHWMVDGHCIRTTHAEANAIAQAAKYGVALDNTECYLTHTPCYTCAKLLYSVGVWRITCAKIYGDDSASVKLFETRGGIRYLNME